MSALKKSGWLPGSISLVVLAIVWAGMLIGGINIPQTTTPVAPVERYKVNYSAGVGDLATPATTTVLDVSEAGILTAVRVRVATAIGGAAGASLVITLDGQATTLTLYSGTTVWPATASALKAFGSVDGSTVGDLVDIPLSHKYQATAKVELVTVNGSGTLAVGVVRGTRF